MIKIYFLIVLADKSLYIYVFLLSYPCYYHLFNKFLIGLVMSLLKRPSPLTSLVQEFEKKKDKYAYDALLLQLKIIHLARPQYERIFLSNRKMIDFYKTLVKDSYFHRILDKIIIESPYPMYIMSKTSPQFYIFVTQDAKNYVFIMPERRISLFDNSIEGFIQKIKQLLNYLHSASFQNANGR